MIAILGLGEQAKAISTYMLELTDEPLVTVDIRDYQVCSKYRDRWKHYKTSGSLTDIFSILEYVSDEKLLIINCLPTEYILESTTMAVCRGWNIVDLAGVTSVERQQMKLHEDAVHTGSVVVRAAGLAPGIISPFLVDFTQHFGEELIGIKAFCGGIPKFPNYPLGYISVFHTPGVIKEYSGVACIIRDGDISYVPTLSEREHVFIPAFGMLEADLTSGGISTTLDNIDLDYFEYKTLRYPGHYQYVKDNILIQPDPSAVLSEMVEPVSADNPDVIILHFEVETTEGIEEFDYFWEYDYKREISAMAQATGYIAAEVGLETRDMDPGVYNMDNFDPYLIRKRVRRIREENNFSEKPIQF